MPRLSIGLYLFIVSCIQSAPPVTGWVAEVPYTSITYRMFLSGLTDNPKLINVTFKANEIPLDTIFFQNDSLHFSFEEFYTEFGGRYDAKENRISGMWITEDSIQIPVTFIPALGDTVPGLHPRTASSYLYSKPEPQGDHWPVCSLSDQNVNGPTIDSLMDRIMDNHYPDVHSLLIARHGCLLVEEYFYTFTTDFRQNIQSVTKSFVSALTGVAIGNGELKDVSETLCTHFPAPDSLACNEQNKSITIHQLLSMSTGLKWDEATYDYIDPRNSAAVASTQPDPFTYLLSQPRTVPVFAYNSLNHSLMNVILKDATHMENDAEIKSRLLDPLGITSYYLGEPDHGVLGDIELRPRDMMKLGQLYLNHGIWDGRQIVPEAWVQQSTSTKIEVRPDLGYGYFWWTTTFNWKGQKVQSYFAWGYGGQYIFVIPQLELVVVLTGSHWKTDPTNHVFEMMEHYILASCNK